MNIGSHQYGKTQALAEMEALHRRAKGPPVIVGDVDKAVPKVVYMNRAERRRRGIKRSKP